MNRSVSKRTTPEIILILGVVFLFLFCARSASASSPEQRAIAQAIEKKLWAHPTWLALGLYRPRLLRPGLESIVEDKRFFISENGKYEPREELIETIKALFNPAPEQLPGLSRGCMYQGRLYWLKKVLDINRSELPQFACPEFDSWYQALAPDSLSLIFPEAYLNNPASMFGHTLLRVDGKGQDEGTRLLAYSITYGAEHQEPPGVVYAFKGLFGFYSGKFSVEPYYESVRKYSDIEHRDIWEYRLDLTSEELELLLRHIWELRDIGSDYYFFTENCSFLLLAMLDTARPELSLQDEFDAWWAIPSETVRAITSRPQLVSSATFRPSASTRIAWMLAHMNPEEAQQANEIASSGLENADIQTMSARSQSMVLEAAFELLAYRSKEYEQLPKERKKALAILDLRSKLSPQQVFPKIPAPATRPDQGHLSGRISAGVGARKNVAFYEIGLRPAYHDLLDSQAGYKQGTQLIVFDILARQYEGHHLNLEKFQLLNTASLSPRDTFFSPMSWKAALGVKRLRRRDSSSGFIAAESRLGLGHTYELMPQSYLFALAETALLNSPSLEQNYALGIGGSIGASIDLSDTWRHLLEVSLLRYPLGEQFTELNFSIATRVELSPQMMLKSSVGQVGDLDQTKWELRLSLERFF